MSYYHLEFWSSIIFYFRIEISDLLNPQVWNCTKIGHTLIFVFTGCSILHFELEFSFYFRIKLSDTYLSHFREIIVFRKNEPLSAITTIFAFGTQRTIFNFGIQNLSVSEAISELWNLTKIGCHFKLSCFELPALWVFDFGMNLSILRDYEISVKSNDILKIWLACRHRLISKI